MPIIKSAKKRVRVARKAAVRNVKTKRSLKIALRGFESKTSLSSQTKAQSALDRAVKKGIIHPNKAARKKRQLAKVSKAAGLKIGVKTSAKSPTAKAAAKKPVTKKPTAKK
jgi:small subunit ribosomal protein S20